MSTSALISGLKKIILAIINFLPGSPFIYLEQTGGIYKNLQYLNWIVPIEWIIETLTLWVVTMYAVGSYKVMYRWFKLLE